MLFPSPFPCLGVFRSSFWSCVIGFLSCFLGLRQEDICPKFAPTATKLILCSAFRATLGQRQIRWSSSFTLNAHFWHWFCKIPVLTGIPVSMYMVVVFPAPLWPSRAVISPTYISMDRSTTAGFGAPGNTWRISHACAHFTWSSC